MIDLDNSFIFVHIPKTAGTSIEHFFAPNRGFNFGLGHDPKNFPNNEAWRQHLTLDQIIKHGPCKVISETDSTIFSLTKEEYSAQHRSRDQKILDSFFKFCFVRNPLDRFVSEFFWRNNFNGFHQKKQPLCFEDFVEKFKEYYFEESEVHYRSQKSFIHTDSDLQIDFVGRFENFESDWKKVLKHLDYKYARAPMLQGSHHKDYRSYYTTRTRNIIEDLYSDDFATFNY